MVDFSVTSILAIRKIYAINKVHFEVDFIKYFIKGVKMKLLKAKIKRLYVVYSTRVAIDFERLLITGL